MMMGGLYRPFYTDSNNDLLFPEGRERKKKRERNRESERERERKQRERERE